MENKKSSKKTKDPKKVAWGKKWQKIHKNKLQSEALKSIKPSINELSQRVKSIESRKPATQTKIVTQMVRRTDLNIPVKFSLFEKIFSIKIPLIEIKKEETTKNKTFTLNRILRLIGLELHKHNCRLNIHKNIIEQIQKERKEEKKEYEKTIKKLEEKIINLENGKKETG